MEENKKDKRNSYVIYDLTLMAPDRSSKDIQSLKTGVINAESVNFPSRVKLYDIYHDIFSLDGHLKGIVGKRIDSVLNKKLIFKDKSGKKEKDVTSLMKSQKGRDLIKALMESKFWGVSGVEFEIGDEFCWREIPRKHIKPEKGLITKSQYSFSESDGYCYEDMPFVWVVGQKHDLGLFLSCALYGIYKRGTLGDYAQFVEIFGQPVRIMEYDAYDTKTKEELRSTLQESGSSLAIMIPKQANFSMLDGKTSNGDGKLQLGLLDFCNDEMSVAILGNTETTRSSNSSGYAQSKEHGEQQEELTASDLIFIENLLNSEKFLKILKSYGYNVEGGCFEYELDVDLAKLKQKLEIDVLVSEKVPVADDYWYETYRIPKPENYKELKAKQEEQRQITNQAIKNSLDNNINDKKLTDAKKKNLSDRFFTMLADFFDQARH